MSKTNGDTDYVEAIGLILTGFAIYSIIFENSSVLLNTATLQLGFWIYSVTAIITTLAVLQSTFRLISRQRLSCKAAKLQRAVAISAFLQILSVLTVVFSCGMKSGFCLFVGLFMLDCSIIDKSVNRGEDELVNTGQ